MYQMKTLKVVAAIIEKDDRILIGQRLKGDLQGRWEFPGGKYEENETGEQAIRREIREEFDAQLTVKEYLFTVEYQYPEFYLVMDCFRCVLEDENVTLHDHMAVRWIDPYEEADYAPADMKVIEEYRKLLPRTIKTE